MRELVSYGRYPHQKGFGRLKDEDRRIIDWALAITGMESFAERDLDALSGGQRQRVWIAMALAQDTPIILLDEPTTYLTLPTSSRCSSYCSGSTASRARPSPW